MPVNCQHCGALLAADALMCAQCGTRVNAPTSPVPPVSAPAPIPAPVSSPDTRRREQTAWGDGCPRCGNYVPPGGSFCPACGTRIQRQTGSGQTGGGGGGWRVLKVLLAVIITMICFVVGALGVLIAACAGMNINAPPTAEAQAFQVKVLVGLVVLFALWIAGMIKLLR